MAPEDKLDVWRRVDRELTTRKEKRLTPSSWPELARRAGIEASKQMLHNWTTRGVPKANYPEIAKALGWTVDQLLGLTDQAVTPSVSQVVSDHQRLFGALTTQQQEDVHAYMMRMLVNVTPGVAEKVANTARPHLGGINTGFGGLDELPPDEQKKAGGGKR